MNLLGISPIVFALSLINTKKAVKYGKCILLLAFVAQVLFSLAFLRLICSAVKIRVQAQKISCSSQLRRTKRAVGRFATFRFAAFFRSKTFSVSVVGSRGNPPLTQTVGP